MEYEENEYINLADICYAFASFFGEPYTPLQEIDYGCVCHDIVDKAFQ